MRKPTMADVADRAGVTVATVSRALNERTAGVLRDETVARVRAAATDLGYRPNVLARGVRTRRSELVGMLISDVTNPFMPAVVRAVEDTLVDAGYTLLSANTDNDPQRELRSLRTLLAHQVDGLLVASSQLDDGWPDEPALRGLPVVLLNRSTHAPLPTVVPDESGSVRLVVEHLVGLGHRRVAHVAGPSNISTGRSRAEAFARHGSAAGVHDPADVEVTAKLAVDDGHAACARLLDRRGDVTAVFAANDLLAIGCVRAAHHRGLRVPEDLSVVGFNDMPLLDLLDPPLTTIRISQRQMGSRAGAMLLALLGGEQPAADDLVVEIPGELVVRRSTAPPRPPAGRP